ncbi:hypothetical protein TB1_006447 [Malus domestica]
MVPSVGPNPPNPQLIQQFLRSVLSQRGPFALPYSENTKWLIRTHLVSLTSAHLSLEPKTAMVAGMSRWKRMVAMVGLVLDDMRCRGGGAWLHEVLGDGAWRCCMGLWRLTTSFRARPERLQTS